MAQKLMDGVPEVEGEKSEEPKEGAGEQQERVMGYEREDEG